MVAHIKISGGIAEGIMITFVYDLAGIAKIKAIEDSRLRPDGRH